MAVNRNWENAYRPSNGSEMESFTESYCWKCINCDPNPSGKKQCEILGRSYFYDLGEPEYPTEWCYIDDKPTCTAWVKWDWDNDGDPDDDNNPKKPIPEDPNQLCMPFILDEIEGVKIKELAL